MNAEAKPERGAPTVHFVYPRDPSKTSSPWCIGNELGDRLSRKYPTRFYGWRDELRIDAQPGDVLLGHPHWSRRSVFKRSLSHPNFARRLLLAPYVGDPRQVAFHDTVIDQCDLFLTITGGYWFQRVGESPMRRWWPKMRHLDLAVNRSHFPLLKTRFNPAGARRFVYIGHTARNKNVGYLSQLQRSGPDIPLHWIGRGRGRIPGLTALGFMDFRQPLAQDTLASFDFMVTVGATDANPTTILESLAWGLIPVCSPQSGYENSPGIVNLPLNDPDAAVAVLRHLNHCDESELLQLRQQGEQQLAAHYHWDRFFAQVDAAIQGHDSPALRAATWGEALSLWRHNLFH
ncbi:hypothetical protein BurJ1DRAFT_1773 [Burkholderiales bacterium JOSHI_001]|nr:hypothetical protein BurJ1DRAFT_1773 [Burkholderiales bacterium JOSHI_001]